MAFETTRQGDLDWLAFQYAAGELTDAELDAFEQLLATDLAACEALARAVSLCQLVAVSEHHAVSVSVGHSARSDQSISGRATSGRATSGRATMEQTVSKTAQLVPASNRKSSRQLAIWRACVLLSSAACLVWMVSWVNPLHDDSRVGRGPEASLGLASLWIQGAEHPADSSSEAFTEDTTAAERAFLQPDEVTPEGSLPEEVQQGLSTELAQSAETGTEVDSSDENDAVPGWLLAAVAEQQRELGEDPEQEVIQD